MLILEATISVLIISGVLIVVYSQQTQRGISPAEFYDSLQGQILADVSASSALRLNVLNVVDDEEGDPNFDDLNSFIGGKIPDGFGYSIRVCELEDPVAPCKMDDVTFIATMDKDIYVEEIIIGAELGSGHDAVYKPKKLRLFVWAGEEIPDCSDDCSPAGDVFSCSADNSKVLKRVYGDFDSDSCLEYDGPAVLNETCTGTCVGGVCTGGAPPADTFWVKNLKADIWFASQGPGEGRVKSNINTDFRTNFNRQMI